MAHFDRVLVRAVHGTGLIIYGKSTTLDAQSLLIDATLPKSNYGEAGRGLSLQSGATMTLHDTRVSGNAEIGIYIGTGSSALASRMLVDGTKAQASDAQMGHGISVQPNGLLTLEQTRITGNRDVGLAVFGVGSAVAAKGLLVDATRPNEASEEAGRGVEVTDGAQLTLHAARLTGNRDLGVMIREQGSTLSATALLIDGTLARMSDGKFGRGLAVQDGAEITVQQARMSANCDSGLFAAGPATHAYATQVLVDATLSQLSDGQSGRGVSVDGGAQLILQDARLSANHEIGAFINSTGSRLQARHLLIDATQPRATDGLFGRGVVVQNGAQVTLDAARISANRDVGVFAEGMGTTFDASQLVIDATQSKDKNFGRGLSAQQGAQIALRDVRASANDSGGMFGIGAATNLQMRRVLVDGSAPKGSGSNSGRGVVGQDQSNLDLGADEFS